MPPTPWKTFMDTIPSCRFSDGKELFCSVTMKWQVVPMWEGRVGPGLSLFWGSSMAWVSLLVPCWIISLFFLFYVLLSSRVHISVQDSRWSLPNRHGILAKPACIEDTRKTWSLSSSSWRPDTRRGIRFAQLSSRGDKWAQQTEDARDKNIFTI